MKARVFIGSSSEQVDTAYAIQRNLERTCDATVWDQGVFALTSNVLDDLVKELDRTDFGIFVFGPDDLTTIRAKEYQSTRDNVVFELGLFIGKIGKARTFFVMPKERGDFRLPSDLVGVTPAEFDETREDRQAALGPACSLIRQKIAELGIRPDRLTELTSFLGIPIAGGLVGIFLPTNEAVHHPEDAQPYTVRSVAFADVKAVVEIVSMLTHLNIVRRSTTFEPGNLFIDESSVDSFTGSTLFLVGGPLPNVFVRNMLNDSAFGIALEDLGHQITISCPGIPAGTYSIRPAREDRTIRQVERYPTYGCIIKSRQGNRTIFAIWGLDERGTWGAGRWLAKKWEFALKEFGEGEFAAIVRFPPGSACAPNEVQRHPDASIPILIPVTPSLCASNGLSTQNAT
ncbi:MAG: nucleotide-binding protein [Nitrososphaera sp.]|nr:nucleotide-binding protein [Nitrososphaera sp.]